MEQASDNLAELCMTFSEAIAEADPQTFLNGGGLKIQLPNGHWSVGIYASETLRNEGEASKKKLIDPLIMLFTSRTDLLEPALECDTLMGLIDKLRPLADWLGYYDYDVGVSGNSLWGKVQLTLARGANKVTNVLAGNW